MKKLLTLLIACLFFIASFTSPVLAVEAGITLNEPIINYENQVITLSGAISTGKGQGVTVVVKNAAGEKDYIDQTISGDNGVFSFQYKLKQYGEYDVLIGGVGIDTPHHTSFQYTRDITAIATINQSTKWVTITGSIRAGQGKEVTVLVTNPAGGVDYANQLTSGEGGQYEFTYQLDETSSGVYQVRVGGEGIDTPYSTTFTYSAPTGDGGDNGNTGGDTGNTGGDTDNNGEDTENTEEHTRNTERLGGANRYETSVKVSQAGWSTADNVVLARGDEFADALSAAPLAKQLNAPILLTSTKALDSTVIAELKRLKVKKVYVIGGTGAISTAVENAVKAMGITVERISGSDRYATSLAIANRMTNKNQVFLATGTSYADALSISSYAAATGSPILLTDKNQISAEVAKFIKDNSSKVYVIGGTGVISEAAVKGIAGAQRISGADRYETNLAILDKFEAGFDFSNIYLATGANYPDAICGSALAGKEKAPIILVNSNDITNQKTYIDSIVEKVSNIKVLGGEGVLTSASIEKLTSN
jgi:putative cell wall-binding protein